MNTSVEFSPSFRLAESIDLIALQREFRSSGFVQIRPFLAPDEAQKLRQHLAGRDDWRLALNTPSNAKELTFTQEALAVMSAQQLEGLITLARQGSESDFRYIYELIRLYWNDERGRVTALGGIAEFMRSKPVLDLIRSITQSSDIVTSDARAMRYGPGHFQTIHTDKHDGYGRRAAYVLSLTEDWQESWGGLLLFHGHDGEVIRSVKPEMNALNLFRVPRLHSVSAVTDRALDFRYSISGWFNSHCA